MLSMYTMAHTPRTKSVRNGNLDAPKSQNTEPELNTGQNPLQAARTIGWELDNPLSIDKVVANPPGPKAASGKPPVLSATLPSETPNANPPEPRKPDQVL
ncbi:hypothetical protein DSO57_1035577 [Entomophthora muscae]|uniref:Uncharacterized protein n=1 Tax=Entomophthora muscae TaxID=34485 RepID=A0ACC2U902_9FUNG|nr:hypothetical protein DSO57_1035577 [Entomophthora muscae]